MLLSYFLRRFTLFSTGLFLLVLGLETLKQGYSPPLLLEALAWGGFGGLLVAALNTRQRHQRHCRLCETLGIASD